MTVQAKNGGATSSRKPSASKWAGLLIRKPTWGLSTRAWLLLGIATACVVAAILLCSMPFLAVTQAQRRGVMVVEGWMPAFMVEQTARLYLQGTYNELVLARPLTSGTTEYESGEFTAHYVAEALVRLGVPSEKVHIVFFEPGTKDRTFAGARAVQAWLEHRLPSPWTVDVVTLGPHARRSRLLFERAFPEDATVGVIALRDDSYDPDHWWRSSSGIREVPFELLAYIYVRCFFRPE